MVIAELVFINKIETILSKNIEGQERDCPQQKERSQFHFGNSLGLIALQNNSMGCDYSVEGFNELGEININDLEWKKYLRHGLERKQQRGLSFHNQCKKSIIIINSAIQYSRINICLKQSIPWSMVACNNGGM